jgi:hypothetical protein
MDTVELGVTTEEKSKYLHKVAQELGIEILVMKIVPPPPPEDMMGWPFHGADGLIDGPPERGHLRDRMIQAHLHFDPLEELINIQLELGLIDAY